jgi:hypothetical protein
MGDFDLMKRLMVTLLLLGAQAGFAYEYRLQFTPPGGAQGIPDAPYSITATLISDGDVPLTLDKALVSTSVSGNITPSPGTATVTATTCPGQIAVGAS